VEQAIERGVNYLNWCGHADGLSKAVSGLGGRRREVVVAAQVQARRGGDVLSELDAMLRHLKTDYLDVATLYYVESEHEWHEIIEPGGAWEGLAAAKRDGRLRMIGLTSHQRRRAADWAETGKLDLLMVRYNAAHRGAEEDVFPGAVAMGIPVVTFTGLRWKALLEPSPHASPGAAECYRFCLSEPRVAVALMAPNDGRELREDLALLEDWRAESVEERERMVRHGEHVRRHAGRFW
jgi:predicted aldo/keto reductase-like oxidoreductase